MLPPLAEGAAWAVLAYWGWRHAATFVLLVLLMVALRRRPPRPDALRWFAATAILWLAIFLVPFHALDAEKSMGKSYAEFAAALPQEGRARIAAWGFDETVRAGLELYGGVVLVPLPPETGEARLRNILLGRDAKYDGVVVRLSRRDEPFWPEEAVLRHRTDVTENRRLLFLSAPETR